jgi:hypothetical protein
MYARWFRQIARAAGIPDEVWNMDARAGGATEADEAGAALEAIQGALTHTKESTTLRYLRRGRSKKIAEVADARTLKREQSGDGDARRVRARTGVDQTSESGIRIASESILEK